MGFLKHIRSRSRLKSQQELQDYPKPKGPDRLSALPRPIIPRIFNFVCPQTADETYRISEKSLLGHGCGLCALKDLASCALVNRMWYLIAQDVLYHSVRIDPVHFCPTEEKLAEKRRKKRVDPLQIPQDKLRLFQRTMWHRPDLAARVQYLKLPYMTRETYKSDLARTVAALPNLRYVDLPDSFFSADPSTQILRDELQANCKELRKMSYFAGAESAFEVLAQRQAVWMGLEDLDLKGLDIEVGVLRTVLASMPALRHLTLHELTRQDDTTFQPAPNIAPFPALEKLRLERMAGITAQGLAEYTSRPEVREALTHLTVSSTGITVQSLHLILDAASKLEYFSISETVTRSLPLQEAPVLHCPSLKTLVFEVVSPDATTSHTASVRPADSYYAHLSSSLHANGLPSLRKLYVRKSNFVDCLLTQSHLPSSAGHGKSGFNQALEIYAKGAEDPDWISTSLGTSNSLPNGLSPAPTGPGRSSFSGRPISAAVATRDDDIQWSGGARMSVMMGNGRGGFLAVPNAEVHGRRSSSSGLEDELPLRPNSQVKRPQSTELWPTLPAPEQSRRSRGDLWR